MRRKIVMVAMLAVTALSFMACGKKQADDGNVNQNVETETNSDAAFSKDAVEVAGWSMQIEDVQMSKSLENVSTVLGYTDAETVEFHQEASAGNQYCLIKCKFEKGSSTEAIAWENMTLTDDKGNTYQRIDDSFISDLGMKRMAGTDLNFGSNEGWIGFEVADDVSALTLEYPFAEETYSVQIK
ncbi:MAG: hypothetical protein ACI4CT_09060 [Lachnospiraceae bacterium]